MAGNIGNLEWELIMHQGQSAGGSAELKQVMRLAALARRDALTPEWRATASQHAATMGGQAIELEPGAVVAGFLPIRSEIDPRPLMYALAERGARLSLPFIVDDETIVFKSWQEGDPLVELKLGTSGPQPTAPDLDPSIMLVPLAAFDACGERIGYGGGYYDRAIQRLASRGLHPRIIGLAFSCQEVDAIPAESHDIRIREVLTETGLRRLDDPR